MGVIGRGGRALRRPRVIAQIIVAFGISSIGQNCCGPGPAPGLDLEYRAVASPNPLFFGRSFSYGVLDANYAWGESELDLLQGVGLAPCTPFPQGLPPTPCMSASFHADFDSETFTLSLPEAQQQLTIHNVHEAQTFMVDPQQLFDAMRALPDPSPAYADDAWMNLAVTPKSPVPFGTGVSLPDAIVMPFPVEDGITTGSIIDPALDPNQFTENIFWFGNASDPPTGQFPNGQVKAVRVIDTGACFNESRTKLQPQFIDRLLSEFKSQVLSSACTGCEGGICSTTFGEVDYLDAASYLTHATGLLGNLGGGFLLRGHVRIVYAGQLGLADCDIVFNYNYEFTLTDGFLDVVPHQNKLTFTPDDGIVCGKARQTFQDALDSTVRATVFGTSRSDQGTDLPEGTDFCAPGNMWPCNVDDDCAPLGTWAQYCDTSNGGSPGFAGVCMTQDPCGPGNYTYPDGTRISSPLLSGRTAIETAIKDGAAVLGINAAQVPRLIAAIDQQDSHGHFRNFSCVNEPSDSGCNNLHCKVLARAKRINVMPDAVPLVFFDDTAEYDNPSFALFVASFAGENGAPPNPQGYRALCDAYPGPGTPSWQSNHFNRTFATGHTPFDTTIYCPPAPPPPLSCNCTNDAQCGPGNGGECDRGECRSTAPGQPCTPFLGGLDCPKGQQCTCPAFQPCVCEPLPGSGGALTSRTQR